MIYDSLCFKGMCPIRAKARASKIKAVLETFEKKKKGKITTEQFTLQDQENIVKNSWLKLQKINKEKNKLGFSMQEDKHKRDVERFKTYVMAFTAANKPGYMPQKKYKYGIEWTDKELQQIRELHAHRKRARSWQKMIPKQDIFTAGMRQTKYARLRKRH